MHGGTGCFFPLTLMFDWPSPHPIARTLVEAHPSPAIDLWEQPWRRVARPGRAVPTISNKINMALPTLLCFFSYIYSIYPRSILYYFTQFLDIFWNFYGKIFKIFFSLAFIGTEVRNADMIIMYYLLIINFSHTIRRNLQVQRFEIQITM